MEVEVKGRNKKGHFRLYYNEVMLFKMFTFLLS